MIDAGEGDAHFLRRAFDVARRARTHGNHPFGAILVDRDGHVLLEAGNGYMPARDATAHAERLVATQACTTFAPEALRDSTLAPLYAEVRKLEEQEAGLRAKKDSIKPEVYDDQLEKLLVQLAEKNQEIRAKERKP